MNLNESYFPVEKIPNPSLDGGVELPSGLQYAVQVTKPDGTKRIVNYCSEIYRLVPNSEIIPLFLENVSKYYKARVEVKMRDWSKFFFDIIIEDKWVPILKNDPVFPKIRIINSYDGSYRYQYVGGLWRQICSNGLGIWENKSRIIKAHTPAIGEEISFGKAMELISNLMADFNDHLEVYHELSETVVKNPANRIEEIIEETGFPSSLHKDVLGRLEEEKTQLQITEVTDWLIYNAFNYQLVHNEDLKAKENKKERMDQEVLDFLLSY